MSETPGPIDKTAATPQLIYTLFHEGVISSSARKEAVAYLLRNRAWAQWIDRLLLFLGSALLLTGIVFFFAYNWADMGRFLKLGLIESGILVSALGASWVHPEKVTGKLLLLTASLLTGVFMAVYFQVYQTGADAFEIFILWSILIFAWVVVSRFQALWILWLTILNTGLILYWIQVMVPESSGSEWAIYPILAMINGAWLLGSEFGNLQGVVWLRPRWTRWLVLASLLTYLSIPTLYLIFEPEKATGIIHLSLFVWIMTVVGTYIFFRWIESDLFSLTLIMFNICMIVLCFCGKVLFEISGGPEMFLLFGFIIVGVTGLAALWLIMTWKTLTRKSRD